MSDVSSTSSSSSNASDLAAGQANLTSSYSTFLTLLTTQLQNQDPTSPMDTNAFTQQLVAMTGGAAAAPHQQPAGADGEQLRVGFGGQFPST